jgi:hypothetical protein
MCVLFKLLNWLGYDINMGSIMIAWFGISFSVVQLSIETILLCNFQNLMLQLDLIDYCSAAEICLIIDLTTNLVSGVACVLAILGTVKVR